MASSEKDRDVPGRDRRHITEQELLESLNRSLWEVERQRAEEQRMGTVGG